MKKYFLLILFYIFMSNMVFASTCSYEQQIHNMALNIYHEARGKDLYSMQLVGEVVLNRLESGKFPNTICDVIYQKNQFSWTTKKDKTPKEKDQWIISLTLASLLINGNLNMIDNGALYFTSGSIKPTWTKHFEIIGTYGDNTFYREKS